MREREITKLRRTANAHIEGLTGQTTIRELREKVTGIAEKLKAEKPELFPKKKPTACFLAKNVELLHITDERDTLIFANGYVYCVEETGDCVLSLEECCREFVNDPEYRGYLNPEKVGFDERKACTVKEEDMKSYPWYFAIMLRADQKCRYNSLHRKGDRCRVDNIVCTEEGEELDQLDNHPDRAEPDGFEDRVIGNMEYQRLRAVAFKGFTEKQIRIMDMHVAGMTCAEIAERLGIKRGSVCTIISRKKKIAKAALLKDMEENGWSLR